jgi:hypothetical protein
MKSMIKSLVVCALVLALGAGYIFAAQEKKTEEKKAEAAPAQVTVVGKVMVTKDAQGAVTAIKLVAEKATYNVTLDAKGKELANMANKQVDAKGTVADKAGVKTITVKEFKEVVAKAAPAPAPKKEEPKK